jgi:dCMP deaminase
MINSSGMNIAKAVSQVSRCLRRKVGAVVMRDGGIIAVGANGPGRGLKPCEKCPRESVPSGEKLNECFATHAEQRAIGAAAYAGLATVGAVMYVTHRPCSMCMKLIIAAGITEVYFYYWYPDGLTDKLVEASDIKLIQMEDE